MKAPCLPVYPSDCPKRAVCTQQWQRAPPCRNPRHRPTAHIEPRSTRCRPDMERGRTAPASTRWLLAADGRQARPRRPGFGVRWTARSRVDCRQRSASAAALRLLGPGACLQDVEQPNRTACCTESSPSSATSALCSTASGGSFADRPPRRPGTSPVPACPAAAARPASPRRSGHPRTDPGRWPAAPGPLLVLAVAQPGAVSAVAGSSGSPSARVSPLPAPCGRIVLLQAPGYRPGGPRLVPVRSRNSQPSSVPGRS